MTLTEQLEAALRHKAADEINYDMQIKFAHDHIAFCEERRELSLAAHDKAILIIRGQIQTHRDLIGEAA